MLKKRSYVAAGLAGVIIPTAGAIMALTRDASAGQSGELDDGKDLLPQAGITLTEAIAAAQGAAQGSVGEVDLEYWQGSLVFNVDVGNQDVKIDAATGAVLGTEGED